MNKKAPLPRTGPQLAVGQIWKDNDSRVGERYLQILGVYDNTAHFTRVHKLDGKWVRFFPDSANGPRMSKAATVRFGLRNGYDFVE